ncbi:MAG: type IV secretory system conjugative DNA transfer family protein [Terriglobia bacterium]
MPRERNSDELIIAFHQGEPFAIDAETRRRHLHLIGQTGTGKTTLLKHLIAQDLRAGRGVAVIDPLGGLAQAVLKLVPASRTHDVFYLDANNLSRPVAFNVLDEPDPDRHATTADDVVAAFVHIFGPEAVGDRSQQVLRNSVRALLDTPAATLLCIPKLLTHEAYRARVVRRVRDPVVRDYWTNQFANYDDRFRLEVTAPLLNKLDSLLSAPALRNIVGQPHSSIDLRRSMHEGRIVIINLSKGAFGERNAHLLGALIVTKFAQAAFARAALPQHRRRPFYLYADEFQDYASAGFTRILSQARAFALSLTLAHQFLGQLSEEQRQAAFGNAASFLSLRVGAEDAPLIAQHLGLDPEIEHAGLGTHEIAPEKRLIGLPNFTAFARFLIGDTPTEPLYLKLLPDPDDINHHPEKVVAASANRFGRDRAVVEDKIRRFLSRDL